MLRLARSARIEIDLLRRQLHFYQGSILSNTYPIAIGKPSTPSPVGEWTVINKKIIKHDSVFGSRWMGLSNPGYGIHGTNNPSSIGNAVSLGCIRMYNYNVETIFPQVSIGTPVIIYNGTKPSQYETVNPKELTNPSTSVPIEPLEPLELQQEDNKVSQPKNQSNKTYRIRYGDTLWKISNKLDIPLHHLIKVNQHINPDSLQVGQIINLP